MIFRAFDPAVKVRGEAVLSFLDVLGDQRLLGLEILQENGIPEPQKGEWYFQQSWLNAFSEIANRVGNQALFNIGLRVVETALWPQDIHDVHSSLSSIDQAFQMNHQGGRIGHYLYTRTGEQEGTMVCDNPYPDEFDRGIIYGTICHFGFCDTRNVQVRIDQAKPIRSRGGLSTTYFMNW